MLNKQSAFGKLKPSFQTFKLSLKKYCAYLLPNPGLKFSNHRLRSSDQKVKLIFKNQCELDLSLMVISWIKAQRQIQF